MLALGEDYIKSSLLIFVHCFANHGHSHKLLLKTLRRCTKDAEKRVCSSRDGVHLCPEKDTKQLIKMDRLKPVFITPYL
jgi:hypothetical protein